MATPGTLRRLALSSSFMLVALLALASPPARAEPVVITGGETALRVNIHTFLRVINAGIQATAIPPARLEFGLNPTVYFPVRPNGAFDVPSSLAPAYFDPVEIDQVVANLVENAIKYTPPGGGIRVTARQDDDTLTVAVEDREPSLTVTVKTAMLSWPRFEP